MSRVCILRVRGVAVTARGAEGIIRGLHSEVFIEFPDDDREQNIMIKIIGDSVQIFNSLSAFPF